MTLLSDMREDNLDAGVYNRQDKQIETSTVVGSHRPDDADDCSWYRELRTLKWIWAGADPLLLQEVYARIAVSDNTRSQPGWLDTVKGYRPGNWIYEFSQEAALFQQLAKPALDAGQRERAREYLLNASLYYSIASFPYLRGDYLAHEAMTLASHQYELACRVFDHTVKRFSVPFDGGKINCRLHLPHQNGPVPVVMVCAGGELLQHSFYPLFEHHLAPAGLGMLTLDLPGTGASERWPLTQDSSCLHQAVLNYMINTPYVLSGKIALLGLRFGGTLAMRLAQLEPARINALALIGTPVHALFSDSDIQQQCGAMVCDQFAARFNADAIAADNLPMRLSALSLHTQGMLGYHRTSMPVLILANKGDAQVPEMDVQRLADACKNADVEWLRGHSPFQCMPHAMEQAATWLAAQLN